MLTIKTYEDVKAVEGLNIAHAAELGGQVLETSAHVLACHIQSFGVLKLKLCYIFIEDYMTETVCTNTHCIGVRDQSSPCE